ncbi:striatin-4, partial [Coturnix japonica]|uniref:striatin-4 n=1 Tax=Coturnix japonica TaxID=93934 RepID=UPI0007780C32
MDPFVAALMAADRSAPTGRIQTATPEPGTGTGTGSGLNLPGILQFIQNEWARFETEKGRWEEERERLQAQVSLLQGQRRGQEKLQADLVRRIKMLEVALRQE